jgi:hypothetical protein
MLKDLTAIHDKGPNLLYGKVNGKDPFNSWIILLEDHLGRPEKVKMHGELALQFSYILVSIVYHINAGEDLSIEVLL